MNSSNETEPTKADPAPVPAASPDAAIHRVTPMSPAAWRDLMPPTGRQGGSPFVDARAIAAAVQPADSASAARAEPAKPAGAPAPAGATASLGVSDELGALVADESETMQLNTYHAVRLFTGPSKDSKDSGAAKGFTAPGALLAAQNARLLFLQSSLDNPFADWALIEADRQITEIQGSIRVTEQAHEAKLEALRKAGVSFSRLHSAAPARVEMRYRSPYGYALALLVVQLDQCALSVLAAQQRSLVTQRDAHLALERLKHKCRSLFVFLIRHARLMQAGAVKGIRRSDFAPTADAASKLRVEAAVGLFGQVPEDIFIGVRRPAHARELKRLSKAEVEMLIAALHRDAATTAAPAPSDAAATPAPRRPAAKKAKASPTKASTDASEAAGAPSAGATVSAQPGAAADGAES